MVFGRGFDLQARLGLDAGDFKREISAAGKSLDSFADGLRAHRTKFLAIEAALTATGVASIKFASDLQEATNKARVTFGDFTDEVDAFANTSADSFGISARAAREYAATLGVILQGTGLTQAASAQMSVELVRLAADLASFNNIPIDVALEKIRAGLVGEVVPLRTVGVLLSETAIQNRALNEGLIEQGQALTEAQKVQLRYAEILDQTTTQQGDFTRTADGLANSTRRMQANLEDAAASLGTQLIPIAERAVSVANELVVGFAGSSEAFKGLIVTSGTLTAGLVGLGLVIPPLVTGIKSLSAATVFLAGNPMVTLIALLGTAAIAATLAGGFFNAQKEAARLKEQEDALSVAQQTLTDRIREAQAAAGAAGDTLTDYDASIVAIGKALTDASTTLETFERANRTVNTVMGSMTVNSQLAEESARNYDATVRALIATVEMQGVRLSDLDPLLKGVHLRTKDVDAITAAAAANTARFGDSMRDADDAAGGYKTALEELTDQLDELIIKQAEEAGVAVEVMRAMKQQEERELNERIEARKRYAQMVLEGSRQQAAEEIRVESEKAAALIEWRQRLESSERSFTTTVVAESRTRAEARAAEAKFTTGMNFALGGLHMSPLAGTQQGNDAAAGLYSGLQGTSEQSQREYAERVADELGLTGAEREAFIEQSVQAYRDLVGGLYQQRAGALPALPGQFADESSGLYDQSSAAAFRAQTGVNVTVIVQGDIHRDDVDRVAEAVEEGIRTGRIKSAGEGE